MTMAEEARAEAERRYPFDTFDPHQSDHHRLMRSVFVQGQRTGWIDHAEWQASREVTEAEARIAELVEWIDHTLTLPMYQEPMTDAARDAASDLRSWRRLLTKGLHPSARAALEAASEVRS